MRGLTWGLVGAVTMSCGGASSPPPPMPPMPRWPAAAPAPMPAPMQSPEVRDRQLVTEAKQIASPSWLVQKRPEVEQANAKAGYAPTPEQVDRQLRDFQAERLAPLYVEMAQRGGAIIVDHCMMVVEQTMASEAERRLAIAVLQRHVPPTDPRAMKVAEAAVELDRAKRPPKPEPRAGGMVKNASEVVAGMRKAFRKCYQQQLNRDPTSAGNVTLIAKIGPDGGVVEVVGGGPVANNPTEFVTCLKGVVAKGDFSPPEGGGATVTIPITFVKE